jgi:hypothetical protein
MESESKFVLDCELREANGRYRCTRAADHDDEEKKTLEAWGKVFHTVCDADLAGNAVALFLSAKRQAPGCRTKRTRASDSGSERRVS